MNSSEQTLASGTPAEPVLTRAAWTPSRAPTRGGGRGMVIWIMLVTLAFVQPLARLASHVLYSNLHSYILIVPLVVAYLLYIRRGSLEATHNRAAVPSAALAAGAMVLIGAAAGFRSRLSENDFLALVAAAYVAMILAGGFLFLGARWMASAAFPMAFLLFLVPLPDAAVDALEKASVSASSEVANAFFSVSGIPFLRDDTVFRLPTITLRVAQECSGIRSSWVLVISSVLAANLFLRRPSTRAALIAFVLPLGIIRNGFRILTLGMLCVHVGPHMIDSPIHHYGGPLFFALSLVPFALFMRWLSRLERRSRC